LTATDELMRSFPQRTYGKVCVVGGNGLSLLPYTELGTRIVSSGNREKALDQHWSSLENKIRLPSLDLFYSQKKAKSAIGNLLLAILSKEGIVNPFITTNWDAFFNSAASFMDLSYVQNPCLVSYKDELCWHGYKSAVDNNPNTVRLWKPHGDIRYAWLNCCDSLFRLSPMTLPKSIKTLYPSTNLRHLDCKNQSLTRLRHHILFPNPSQTEQEKFKSEIDGSRVEIEEAKTRGVKMILIVGFAGWEYEELVDPIIGQIGQLPIFYISTKDWAKEDEQGNEVPKLWKALKNVPNTIIIADGSKTLLALIKNMGFFVKYEFMLKRYVRMLND
jgi:hypothetical protein